MVVGRGGLFWLVVGGIYMVIEKMIDDLKENKYGEYVLNLGVLFVKKLVDELIIFSFIVDLVVVDEM